MLLCLKNADIMKKIIYLSFLWLAVFANACKKDNPATKLAYEDLDGDHIISILNNDTKLSEDKIDILGSGDRVLLKPGSIILFKTNSGYYGKMKLGDVSDIPNKYFLDLDIEYYSNSWLSSPPYSLLNLQGSYSVDLDGAKIIADDSSDFQWASVNDAGFSIVPKNGAKFYLYAIK